MRCNSKLSGVLFPVLAMSGLLASSANADEPVNRSLVNPTWPQQYIFPSPVPESQQSVTPQLGQYSLEDSTRRNSEGYPLLSLHSNRVSVRTLLEGIAKRTGLRILMGDDVANVLITTQLKDLTVPQLIQFVCDAANLTSSRMGQDTFLVVPRKPSRITLQAPIYPGPLTVPKLPQNPPNWRGFDFNGQTYFVVPLQARDGGNNSTETPVLPQSTISSRLQLKKQESDGTDKANRLLTSPAILPSR